MAVTRKEALMAGAGVLSIPALAKPAERVVRPLTATLFIESDGTIQVLNFITRPGTIDKVVYPCLSLEVALATLAALAEGKR